MPSVLLKDAIILTVDGADRTYDRGWVSFADGRITGVGPAATTPGGPFDQVHDLTGHLVMPGLVNAHTHAAMILFRGRSAKATAC